MASIKIASNSAGGGVLTLEAPASTTNRTITLPDSTGTLVTSSGPTFSGSVVFQNDITVQGTLYETSAAVYKDNIVDIPSQLDNILSLRPVEYDKKTTGKHEIGLVAEEVAEVYPDMVEYKEGRPEALNYSKMVSILVKAVQELSNEIKELKSNG